MKQKITRRKVAAEIERYLRGKVSLPELVDWAENIMMDGDISDENGRTLRNIVARLGVADVRSFGLTWEDCQRFLSDLGYKVQVQLRPA